MPFKPVILWTDALVFLLVPAAIAFGWYVEPARAPVAPWRKVAHSRYGMCALVVLVPFVAIGLLDSLHYRPRLEALQADGQRQLLRRGAERVRQARRAAASKSERTYSAPLAAYAFAMENVTQPGRHARCGSSRASSTAART